MEEGTVKKGIPFQYWPHRCFGWVLILLDWLKDESGVSQGSCFKDTPMEWARLNHKPRSSCKEWI